MNLCIDIGNTRIKLYKVEGQSATLLHHQPEWEEDFEILEKTIIKHEFTSGILSSTRTKNENLIEFLEQNLKYFLLLDNTIELPFDNLYETPKSLGRDRMAVAAAALDIFPDENSLIINMGSCITYDFITKEKKYLGGSISPGMKMRFKAMNSFTDKLPLVEAKEVSSFIGINTETSLITGVIEGIICEISGRISQYEEEFGEIRAILTGGDAIFFENKLKNEIFADSNFLPIGLNAILEHNKHN